MTDLEYAIFMPSAVMLPHRAELFYYSKEYSASEVKNLDSSLKEKMCRKKSFETWKDQYCRKIHCSGTEESENDRLTVTGQLFIYNENVIARIEIWTEFKIIIVRLVCCTGTLHRNHCPDRYYIGIFELISKRLALPLQVDKGIFHDIQYTLYQQHQ